MMMTTRAMAPLPDHWAGPILDLVARARDAAAPPGDDDGAWAAADAGQVRPRTGHKAARRTATAGQLAAHLLRLHAIGLVAQGESDPWTVALTTSAPAISSWDWDERMQGALDLRRTFKDLPDSDVAATRPARLVAAWLTHAGGAPLVPATGRLAEYALEQTPINTQTLATAWYATHGARLLAILAARGTPNKGRQTLEAAAHNTLVRAAVSGVYAAQIMSKVDITRLAGITRPTLNAWIST